jgi:hypothetical protein
MELLAKCGANADITFFSRLAYMGAAHPTKPSLLAAGFIIGSMILPIHLLLLL